MTKESPYARAVQARRESDKERQARLMDEIEERERALEDREREATWKAEFAYEVLRAIMTDLKNGKPVGWARLSQAGEKLRGKIPDEALAFLQKETILDKEERKETPEKKSEDR